MSLTSFLGDEKRARILIDQTFERPSLEQTPPRRAEPQTSNYALIGTAFDYILRFWLEREYPGTESQPWVAHQGLSLAETVDMDTTVPDTVSLGDRMETIEQAHQAYLDTGELTDELLAGTLDLARFDWIYRSGSPPEDLGKAADGDITDLRQLYDTIPAEEFRGAERVLLNPTFGSASRLVNGADADLILDDSLIDIKTVKDYTIKPDYWRQLVGYAVLADLASDELDSMSEFSTVGLYFARHGVLWQTPAAEIYGHEKYDQFKSWFQEMAEKHFSPSV
ncbi:hypothetical protein [Halosegnis longus]|uniref:hypothetical protein n=1 Tax=Halosegnis longus TaxID=2216012 RepID=UPI00129E220A|nr:hypothetical protein [Halosegnis longus]